MFIKNVFLGPHMKKGREIFTAEDEEAYKYTFNKKSKSFFKNKGFKQKIDQLSCGYETHINIVI